MKMTASCSFVAQVMEYMMLSGISRSELARRLGMQRGFVTRMLNADWNFTFKTAERICDALGMDFKVTVAHRKI